MAALCNPFIDVGLYFAKSEVWSQELFNRLYVLLNEGGILTTYCAKGVIRRMLQAAGFTVERLPGPPGGKREILRARKLEQNQPPILIQ